MSEEDVRKAVEPLILEYFENSDSMEVLFTLQEMLPNLGKYKNGIHTYSQYSETIFLRNVYFNSRNVC